MARKYELETECTLDGKQGERKPGRGREKEREEKREREREKKKNKIIAGIELISITRSAGY